MANNNRNKRTPRTSTRPGSRDIITYAYPELSYYLISGEDYHSNMAIGGHSPSFLNWSSEELCSVMGHDGYSNYEIVSCVDSPYSGGYLYYSSISGNWNYSGGCISGQNDHITSIDCFNHEYGCTDNTACNFNENATLNDGSCEYPELYYDCDGNPINDSDGDGFPDEIDINPNDPCPSGNYDECGVCDGNGDCHGCMDENACNYDPDALFQPEGICHYEDVPNEDGFNCYGECIVGYDICGVCGGGAESYEECPMIDPGGWEPASCPQCEGPDSGLYCCDPCAMNYCTLLSSDAGNYNPTCDYGTCCKCPGSPSVTILHSWEECPTGCAPQDCPSFCEEECPYDTPEDCEGWEWIEPIPGCRYGGGALDETWCNEFWNGDTLSTPGRGYSHETFSCRNQPPGSVVIYDDNWHSNTYETPYNYNPIVNIEDCSCIIGGTLSPYYHQTQCDGGILSSTQVKLMEDCSLCGEDRDWIQGCPDPKALNYHPYAAVGCIDVACYCGMRDGVPGKMEDRGALDCCQYDQYWNVNWPNIGAVGSTDQWFLLIDSDEIANIQLPDGSYLQDGDEIGFFQDVIEISFGGNTYYVDNYIMNCSNCNEEVAEEFVCSGSWASEEPVYCIPDFDNISGGAQDHFLVDENGNIIETGAGWYCEYNTEEMGVFQTEGDCVDACFSTSSGFAWPCYYQSGPTCDFGDDVGDNEEYAQAACLPRCQCTSASDCIFELETTNELSEGTCKHNSQAIWNYRIKGYEEYGTPEYWVGGFTNRTDVVAVQDGLSYIVWGAIGGAPFTVKIYRKETNTIYDCVHIDGSATGVVDNQGTEVRNISVLSAQECGVGCTDPDSLNCSPWCSQCGCDPNDDGCQECQDDGSCIEHTYGCMDANAYNYNPYATAECTDPENQNDCLVCDYDCDRCIFFGFGGITENENGNPVVSVMVSANSEKILTGAQFSVAGAYNVIDVYGGMIDGDDENLITTTHPFINIVCANPNTCGQDFVITTEPQVMFYMELERKLTAVSIDGVLDIDAPEACFHIMGLGNATPPYVPLVGLVDIGMNPNYPSCFNSQYLEQGWIPGDVNQDGTINVADVIRIVSHIIGTESLNELERRIADVNQDGQINVTDVLYLVNLIMGNVPYPQQQQVEEELRRAMRPLNTRQPQHQTPIRPGDEKQQLIDKILRKQR